jgi:hypothetical protein
LRYEGGLESEPSQPLDRWKWAGVRAVSSGAQMKVGRGWHCFGRFRDEGGLWPKPSQLFDRWKWAGVGLLRVVLR